VRSRLLHAPNKLHSRSLSVPAHVDRAWGGGPRWPPVYHFPFALRLGRASARTPTAPAKTSGSPRGGGKHSANRYQDAPQSVTQRLPRCCRWYFLWSRLWASGGRPSVLHRVGSKLGQIENISGALRKHLESNQKALWEHFESTLKVLWTKNKGFLCPSAPSWGLFRPGRLKGVCVGSVDGRRGMEALLFPTNRGRPALVSPCPAIFSKSSRRPPRLQCVRLSSAPSPQPAKAIWRSALTTTYHLIAFCKSLLRAMGVVVSTKAKLSKVMWCKVKQRKFR